MCGQRLPIVITVAASDPILLAVAHGDLALTSGDRVSMAEGRSRSP
jgi:hypothetical protein